MIKLLPTIPGGSAKDFDRSNHLIGVALWTLPGYPNTLAMGLFSELVMRWLIDAGMEAQCRGHLFGPCFLLCLAEVQDRNGAVQAIQNGLEGAKRLSQSIIAYYDVAEAFWRAVHPQPNPDFGQFLSEANIKATVEALARNVELFQGAQHRSGDAKPGNE